MKQIDSQEDHYVSIGMCVGWGACTFLTWIERDCSLDSSSILNFAALILIILLTIKQRNKPL